jgi:hypothetical protein
MTDGSMLVTMVARISGNGQVGKCVVNTVRKSGRGLMDGNHTGWVIVGNPNFPDGDYDIAFADVTTKVRRVDGVWKFLDPTE